MKKKMTQDVVFEKPSKKNVKKYLKIRSLLIKMAAAGGVEIHFDDVDIELNKKILHIKGNKLEKK